MKLFVMGSSRSGKTPFARDMAAALGVPHVGASAWVRARFPADAALQQDRAAFVEAITRFSLAELRRDPAICVDHLRREGIVAGPCVIEGVRNPYDFVHLFDPRSDVAVFLEHEGNELSPTAFERGLEVIRAYLAWLRDAGLLDESAGPRVFEHRFRHFYAREGSPSLDDAVAACRAALLARPPPVAGAESAAAVETPGRESFVHAEIPPLRLHVRREFLHGMDPACVGQHVPCTAFAVSSYVGSAPTFKILLADGAVFSYVPPHALVAAPRRAAHPEPELSLAELVYHSCRSAEICVTAFHALDGDLLAFIKQRDLWIAGRYLFTLDWYTGNDLLHAVLLANGQLALLPHHKLKFHDDKPGFQPYKKMRNEWKV